MRHKSRNWISRFGPAFVAALITQLKSVLAQLKPGNAGVLQIERRSQFQYLAFEME